MHNALQVTPSGAVYSEAGMNEVAAQNGGVFLDPITGAIMRAHPLIQAGAPFQL